MACFTPGWRVGRTLGFSESETVIGGRPLQEVRPLGEGLSGSQRNRFYFLQKEGMGNRKKAEWLFSRVGRGGGAGVTPFCAWGSLCPRRMGRTCCCQLVYAKVFLVFSVSIFYLDRKIVIFTLS